MRPLVIPAAAKHWRIQLANASHHTTYKNTAFIITALRTDAGTALPSMVYQIVAVSSGLPSLTTCEIREWLATYNLMLKQHELIAPTTVNARDELQQGKWR